MKTLSYIHLQDKKNIIRICAILTAAFLVMLGVNIFAFFRIISLNNTYIPLQKKVYNLKMEVSRIQLLVNKELLNASNWQITEENNVFFKGDMNNVWRELHLLIDKAEMMESISGRAEFAQFKNRLSEVKQSLIDFLKSSHANREQVFLKIESQFNRICDEATTIEDGFDTYISQRIITSIIIYSAVIVVNIILFIAILVSFYQYILRQNRFSRASQQKSTRLTQLMDSLDSIIVAISPKGFITQWNKSAARFFDMPANEVIDKKVEQIIPFMANYQFQTKKAISSLETSRLLKEKIEIRGVEFTVNMAITPFNFEDGINVIIEISDLTELEAREKHLRQAQKMEVVENMLGGLVNEFNNVLSILNNCAILLRRSAKSSVPDFQQIVNDSLPIIENSVERASVIVQQMLSFSIKRDLEITQTINLNTLINHIGKICDNTLDKRIKTAVFPHSGKAVVKADPHQLELILLNICDNGAKAILAKENPQFDDAITLSIKRVVCDSKLKVKFPEADQDSYWVLKVADTGIGMSEQTCKQIFDPFFTTEGHFHGSGLGLTIAHDIIRRHNGFIDVESKLGEGTTFSILLPEEHSDFEEIVIEEIEEKEKLIPLGKGTVLVVDDEFHLREMAEKILNMYGYDAIQAANGREALEIFLADPDKIDVVFMDMLMPDISGLDVFLEMKNIDPSVKVIMVSGYCSDDLIEESLNAGVIKFLRKPYSIEDLVETVHEHVS